MPDYFKCDPEKCGGARCCKSPETKPALSVGDLLRIEDLTGEPLKDILYGQGEITLLPHNEDRYDIFFIVPSLIHESCPYLRGSECGIYRARPIECAAFPLHLSPQELELYGDYECIRDASFSEEQRALGRRLLGIGVKEAGMTEEILGDRLLVITQHNARDLAENVLETLDRNSLPVTGRKQRVLEAATKLKKVSENRGVMNIEEYMECLARVLYPWMVEGICRALQDMGSREKGFFRDTTKEYLEIMEASGMK